MKFAIVAGLMLLCSASVFSSPLGFKKFHKLHKLNPLPALGKLLSPSKPDVELIPLSEYPVWRLHHYKGLELKPVALPEAPSAAYPAPSTEFVNTNPKPEAVYGDSSDSLSILDGGFAMLDGVRDAFSTIGHRITALPSRILSTIGLGDEGEEAAGLIPRLPGFEELVHLPAAVWDRLPKLPSLPLTLTNGKKKLPAIYVIVNKPEHKEKPVVTYEPPKEQTPVTYEAPKPEYGAPVAYQPPTVAPTYEAPKPEYGAPVAYQPPTLAPTYEAPKPEYGAPVAYQPHTVSPTYEAPKPEYGVPSSTYDAASATYEAPKPEYGTPIIYEVPTAPVAYEVPQEIVNTYEAPKPSYEKPPFELPSTYENPRPVYGAPVQTYSVPSNSYGPPEGLIPPFAPSKSFVSSPVQNSIQVDLRVNKQASSRSDEVIATPRATEKSLPTSTPTFIPSPVDPVIVLPENKTE